MIAPDPTGESADSFDYIIAGGGSAGCVLANRLSADPAIRVCLIEAGPRDRHWRIKVPVGVVAAINHKQINWHYMSAPQPALGDRPYYIPRGRVLGGSSSINGMAYFRGHPGDFDDWAALAGPGWGYADLLPYFIRSEHNPDYAGSPYHGMGGEMAVSNPPRPNPLIARFLAATDLFRLPRNADFNGPDPEGFGLRQATIRNGRRESMATAFLHPVQGRPNLTILTDTLIDRLSLTDRRVTGLHVIRDGERQHIACRREVILAGGAYGSPAIAMRSGLGPAADLKAAGIDPVADLPGIGRNLQDHPSAACQWTMRDSSSYGLSLRAMPRNIWNLLEYLTLRKGPMGGNIFEVTGFMRSRPDVPRPDLQIVFIPVHRNARPYPLPIGHGFGILSILVRPKSSGSVTLASADPAAAPRIDPQFYSHPDDMPVIRHGLKFARDIAASQPFARYKATEIVPGPATQSDVEWDAHIRRNTVTVHHPCASMRMGRDDASPVDAALRVKGVEGLRVADAAAFPAIIAGNTNAAVVALAEKAADLILGKAAPAPIHLPHAG